MNIIWIIVAAPIILSIFLVEYLLLRINNKFGLLVPLLSVISIIPLGVVGIVLTVISFLIYFIQSFLLNKKGRKQREIEKMRIEDL